MTGAGVAVLSVDVLVEVVVGDNVVDGVLLLVVSSDVVDGVLPVVVSYDVVEGVAERSVEVFGEVVGYVDVVDITAVLEVEEIDEPVAGVPEVSVAIEVAVKLSEVEELTAAEPSLAAVDDETLVSAPVEVGISLEGDISGNLIVCDDTLHDDGRAGQLAVRVTVIILPVHLLGPMAAARMSKCQRIIGMSSPLGRINIMRGGELD